MSVSLVLNEASVSEASLASAPRAGSVRELLFQLVHPQNLLCSPFTHDGVEGEEGERRDLPFSNVFVLRILYMHTICFSHIYSPFPSRTILRSHSQLCALLFKPIDSYMGGCGAIKQSMAGNPDGPPKGNWFSSSKNQSPVNS